MNSLRNDDANGRSIKNRRFVFGRAAIFRRFDAVFDRATRLRRRRQRFDRPNLLNQPRFVDVSQNFAPTARRRSVRSRFDNRAPSDAFDEAIIIRLSVGADERSGVADAGPDARFAVLFIAAGRGLRTLQKRNRRRVARIVRGQIRRSSARSAPKAGFVRRRAKRFARRPTAERRDASQR